MIFGKKAIRPEPLAVPLFFVTSYGRTATYWLTAMLNSHPDIYCTHGPTLKRLTGAPNDPPVEHTSEVFRNQEAYYALEMEQLLQEMQQQQEALVYGNVHAFTAMRLQNKIRSEHYGHIVSCANLLRHPVTRLDSYTKHCIKQSYDDEHMRNSFCQFVEGHTSFDSFQQMIRSKYGVDFSSVENKMFLLALIMLGNDLSDTEVGCKQAPYERLVSDIEYFQWFFHYITGGRVTITDQMLSEFRSSHRKNTANATQMTSQENIRRWEKWQVFLLQHYLRTSSKAAALYRQMEYDIDFIFDIPTD